MIARLKSRTVARGNEMTHYRSMYSPVACAATIRFLLAVAVTFGLHLRVADVKTAFLYAKMPDGRNVYVKPPPGSDCGEDEVWKLKRALYGLPSAPSLWHSTFTEYLKSLEFKQCTQDPCLFIRLKQGEYVIMVIIVDDILLAANTKEKMETMWCSN